MFKERCTDEKRSVTKCHNGLDGLGKRPVPHGETRFAPWNHNEHNIGHHLAYRIWLNRL